MRWIKSRSMLLVAGASIALAACGGGDTASEDDSSTAASTESQATTGTSDAPTTTTASLAVGSTDNWCAQADEGDSFNVPDLTSAADIEASATQYLAAIDQIVASAPSEIQADVAVIAEAARMFFSLLEEYDWDFLAIPPDDERLTAFDDGGVEQASRNIAEYCGFDLDDPAAASGFGSDPLPEAFPDEFVPPGTVEFVADQGVAGVIIGVDADFDDVVDHYVDLLGVERAPGVDSVILQGMYNGNTYVIVISEGTPVFVSVASF